MKRLKRSVWLSFTLGIVSLAPVLYAAPAGRPLPMITEAVDEAKLATLEGNTRPEATAANDRGIVSDDFKLDHLLLQLQRSPEREAAIRQYIDELHDAKSVGYHQWLTPEQFAEYYGVAKADVDTVTAWLKSKGFAVNGVQASGLMIDFSGTAGLVRGAFRTEIHSLEVKGVKHFANMSDPRIPAALRPAVAGIVSLHDFHPKPQLVAKSPQFTYTNSNGTFHALVAGDLAAIYNFNPLFAAGIAGNGQSIMVVEDTYLYSTNDWTVFRNTFGLTTAFPNGTLSQVSPTGAINCINPGFQGVSSDPGYGDDGEAAIDVEYATAAAPNAAIILAACTDTTAFGGLIALENILNGPTGSLPSVVSISYGEDEAFNGAANNLAYNNAYQQAVTEGVSIFVSSGDQDAASSDLGNVSTHGIGISGFTSTPYNVSVGGTDFGYTADFVNPATYFSPTNTNTYSSALSYIQEIPWNGSCAGALLANFIGAVGLTSTTDPLSLCNNALVTSPTGELNFFLNAFGGSGGPSACATGTASSSGKVSGTCAGYPKPSFQSGLFGNPADGVRDIPDVSLFASNGIFDAYYVVCWSNPDTVVGGGFTCTGDPSTWSGFGGTSVSSPIMAGIQALVNQQTGTRWGNPNTVYYSLANTEYGASGNAACNSTTVNKTGNPCIFYDVTQGDNDGVCKARSGVLTNCYLPSGTYGVLSTSNTADQPAYSTGTGWDFPTGIGSVNAYNLVMNFPAAVTLATNPSGLLVSVDGGTAQPAPFTVSLPVGPHTVAVAATQAGTPGTQYVFTGWSDTGAASHSISVVSSSPVTYTAIFQTQYQLTTAASPSAGGTVAPASGTFLNAGSQIVQATANAGYQFANFSGGTLTGSTNPQTFTLSGPANVVANFTPLTPNIAASVGTRTVSGPTVMVNLTLTNTGLGAATNVTITSITAISDVAGSGVVTVASGTPQDLGPIGPKGSAQGTVTFNWPSTATRVGFTVNFTADGGYSGSSRITTIY